MGVTAGTWKIVTPLVGAQPIADVSTTQNHPFGTKVTAKDVGSTGYGEGEFVYVKGVTSGATKKWAGYNHKTGATTLAVADGNYPIGVMMSDLDATTDFGWLQIKGRAIGKALTAFADNGVVYLTSTAGSVDDASVIGDVVHNAVGRNGAAHTVGDLAGEFLDRIPFKLGFERYDDVEPLPAGGLHEAGEAKVFQEGAHIDRGLDHLGPLHRFIGIEVEDDHVGVFDVLEARAPDVNFEHAALDEGNQSFGGIDHQNSVVPALADPFFADGVRQARAGVFLEEACGTDAVGTADERERTLGHMGQHRIRDRFVVGRDFELGDVAVGINGALG